MAGVKQIAVDLVRAQDKTVALTEVCQQTQFIRGINPAHRIMGIAENEGPGAGAYFLFEIVPVKGPASILEDQMAGYALLVLPTGCGEKGWVNGSAGQYFVPRISKGSGENIKSGNQTVGPDQPFPFYFVMVGLLQVVDNGIFHFGVGDRVAHYTVVHSLVQCL